MDKYINKRFSRFAYTTLLQMGKGKLSVTREAYI